RKAGSRARLHPPTRKQTRVQPAARRGHGRAVIRGGLCVFDLRWNRSSSALAALIRRNIGFVKTSYKFMGNKWLISVSTIGILPDIQRLRPVAAGDRILPKPDGTAGFKPRINTFQVWLIERNDGCGSCSRPPPQRYSMIVRLR